MAELSELPLSARLFMKAYQWRRIDPVPFAPLRRALQETTVTIVSTAGLVLPDQPPFDNSVKGGDSSYREIPSDIDVTTLRDTHRSESFDHRGVESDPNLAFPLETLRAMERDGAIGGVARRHFSFMGSITAPGHLTRESAPAVADLLEADGAEAVLLVPI